MTPILHRIALPMSTIDWESLKVIGQLKLEKIMGFEVIFKVRGSEGLPTRIAPKTDFGGFWPPGGS